MIAWIIMNVVLIIICVVLFIISYDSYDFEWLTIVGTVLVMLLLLFMIPITIITPFDVDRQITVFEQQSEYIQNHKPDDYIENAALTNKKIELNEWLYKAQWKKEKFGSFSFYPEMIFDLKPIN